MAAGKTLRVETLAPAQVHWSADGWLTSEDNEIRETCLGVYMADLETCGLAPGAQVDFTFYWPLASRWEGVDFTIRVNDCCP